MRTRLHALALAALLVATPVLAAGIFDGDPIDPTDGRAYAILPGVPLILHQPGKPNDYAPPIIDPSIVGDVDIVVRAGSPGIGPVMPPPVATPPVGVAGGLHVAAGTEIPFTVIASSGGPGVGTPLGGTSLDLVPVVVFAWADLDGDGFVGPTNDDVDGASDNGRELQEALFPIGRQVAIFSGGVAQGTVAVWKGAPASAGGLSVVLTAVAYVGPFDPRVMNGNVPDGPGVATLLPFFPRLDPKAVIEGDGRGGKGDPNERLGVVLEPAFDIPVAHPTLGTPFALPTDGSSPTIDRAVAVGGPASRLRFVQPSSPTQPASLVEIGLVRGAGGALFEPLVDAAVADDGPGNGTHARLIPVDAVDAPTDPATPLSATLVAGPGLVIASPDTDGNPSTEPITVGTAAGIDVVLDDTGGAGDSGGSSTLTVVVGGFPVDVLPVHFTGAGGATPPAILGVALAGSPSALEAACPVAQAIAATITSPTGFPVGAAATVTLDGSTLALVPLRPGTAPPGAVLPPGPVFRGTMSQTKLHPGALGVTVTASNAAGAATPVTLSLPVVAQMPPGIGAVGGIPPSVPLAKRTAVVVSAPVQDACGVRSVTAYVDTGSGFRKAGRLTDRGRSGDAVAGDGIFTGRVVIRTKTPGTFPLHLVAKDRINLIATGADVPVVVSAN